MLEDARQHIEKVKALCCIVCRNQKLAIDTPAEIRYIDRRREGFKRQWPARFEAIPLCSIHHRIGNGSPRYQGQVAVRKNLFVFERMYGTEAELLRQTMLEVDMP